MTLRPRPVDEISGRESWWSIGSALVPGAVVLAAALAAGRPITSVEIGAAMLAVLVPLGGAEVARRRTVTRVEKVVTPTGDPRDDTGETLRPRDADVLELALDELRTRRDEDAAARADERSRPGTRAFPDVGSARPMRAADGPPSKQVHDEDWVGEDARAYDEGWKDRSSDPSVRRSRDVADRSDRRRRHQLDERATRR